MITTSNKQIVVEDGSSNSLLSMPAASSRDTPLFNTLRSSPSKTTIEHLLFNGQKKNLSKEHSFTPLMKAACEGDLKKAQKIIDAGTEIDAFTDTGVTALMFAAKNGHLEIVKLLCEHEAKINSHSFGPMANIPRISGYSLESNGLFMPFQTDPKYYDSLQNGFTPLILAIAYGHKEIVSFFFSENADLNMKGFGASPLAVAIYYGQSESAKSLITHGAEIESSKQMVGRQGDLLELSLQRKYWDIATLFLDKSKDLNSIKPKISGLPYLHYYSAAGNSAVVEFLCKKGADPNLADNNGMTPILYASRQGKHPAVKKLYELGADINSASLHGKKNQFNLKPGSTPLLLTLRRVYGDSSALTRNKVAGQKLKDCFNMADFLISHGADMNTQDENGNSPLADATASGSVTVMEYLINKGADVNLANNRGETPVIIAVKNKKPEKVRALINSGTADLNRKDFKGQSPLLWAIKNRDITCGTLFLNNGADASEVLANGEPLLLMTIRNNYSNFNFSELLIEKGANVNATDKDGNTALMLIAEKKCGLTVRNWVESGKMRNVNEQTAIKQVLEKKCFNIAKKLVESGAKINTHDNYGINAYALAKYGENQNIINYLKDHGADSSAWKAHVRNVLSLKLKNIPDMLLLTCYSPSMAAGVLKADPTDIHPGELLRKMERRKHKNQ